MDLKTYQIESRKTAIYPNTGSNTTYPILGLFGEFGEIAEKVKKVERDQGGIYNEETLHLLRLECGDVAWYVAQYASERYVMLEDCKPSGYSIVMNDLPAVIIELGVNIGEMVSFRLHEDSDDHMYRIGLVIRSLSGVCHLLGTDLGEVMDQNIEKLNSRKERGVLQGTGDER